MYFKCILFLSCFFACLIFSVKGQEVATAKTVNPDELFTPNLKAENAMTADSLLQYASGFLKTPYRMGATGPNKFDCSGFTSYVYRQFGYSINRTSRDQAYSDGVKVDRNALKRGDLVFFQGRSSKQKGVRHVGIVYEVFPDGTFTFIHASVKKGVTITESTIPYYNSRYITAKRILEEEMIPNPEPIRKSSYKMLPL